MAQNYIGKTLEVKYPTDTNRMAAKVIGYNADGYDVGDVYHTLFRALKFIPDKKEADEYVKYFENADLRYFNLFNSADGYTLVWNGQRLAMNIVSSTDNRYILSVDNVCTIGFDLDKKQVRYASSLNIPVSFAVLSNSKLYYETEIYGTNMIIYIPESFIIGVLADKSSGGDSSADITELKTDVTALQGAVNTLANKDTELEGKIDTTDGKVDSLTTDKQSKSISIEGITATTVEGALKEIKEDIPAHTFTTDSFEVSEG